MSSNIYYLETFVQQRHEQALREARMRRLVKKQVRGNQLLHFGLHSVVSALSSILSAREW